MDKSSIQFTNPHMEEFVFKVNKNFKAELFNDMPIKLHTNIAKSSTQCVAKVSLSLDMGAEEDKFPFYANLVMSSMFRWDKETENVDVLLRQNASAMLYSYMRPIIANATANARFEPLDLPFMNFLDVDSDMSTEE